MLKLLVKKQLSEVFRGYFYDSKRNRMRKKSVIAVWVILFLTVMIFLVGGMFTVLSLIFCGELTRAGLGWLYYLIMGVIAVVLGALGSVFNSYEGLFLAKDNDLLLSMPIPVPLIIASRLINVYLMGAMYSSTAIIPAIAVYFITVGVTPAGVFGALMMLAAVTVTVMLLSCLLGWGVARISKRLRNRSFITVLASLAFVGAYYFLYFRASGFINAILSEPASYAERVKGAAFILYLFGRVGEGDPVASLAVLAIIAVLFAAVWLFMKKSFLGIASAGQNGTKKRFSGGRMRRRPPFAALIGKEFSRFLSSPNYMLNCGLGILIMPAAGAAMLVMGRQLTRSIALSLPMVPDGSAMLFSAGLISMTAVNILTAPSVSLEGKSIWIPQMLPVEPKTVLRAKAAMQLILTLPPAAFTAVCAASAVPSVLEVKVLMVLTALIYSVFSAFFGLFLGVRMPLLKWTSEISPIKQSGSVAIALFGGMGISAVFGLGYFLGGFLVGAVPYLAVWDIVLAAVAVMAFRWLDTEGARAFAAL